MPRTPSRSRSMEARARRSLPSRGAPDAFGRVLGMVTRASEEKVSAREVRENLGDLVRVSARVRALEKRIGRRGAAELSPYLQSLLRVAGEPRIVKAERLRVSA